MLKESVGTGRDLSLLNFDGEVKIRQWISPISAYLIPKPGIFPYLRLTPPGNRRKFTGRTIP